MSEKKLFLLDAFALIYRAHFAFISRPLINSKGQNTSAITGFTRALWDLIRNENPTHLAVAFDRPEPTFRHEMFPEYKANREEQPKDITWSIPYIRKIVAALDIPIVEQAGMEADDIIGTLAHHAAADDYQVYMVTPDKDYGQLVRDNVFMYKPSRKGEGAEILGVDEILEKWDIKKVNQVIDILGLQGDSSDNIPGVRGIGPKTAAKLLASYDSIEGIYENLDEIKGSAHKKLAEQKDIALLSKALATIKIDCDIPFDPDRLIMGKMDRKALAELFNELEFRTLKRDILGAEPKVVATQGTLFDAPITPVSSTAEVLPEMSTNNISNTDHDYKLLENDSEILNLVELLSKQSHICFDTETDNIDATQANIVGIAFSCESGKAFYINLPESFEESQRILNLFDPIWSNEKIEKIGQNLKYDLIVLRYYGIVPKGKIHDTMIMHYLLEPALRHNLNYLAESYLNYKCVSIESLIGKKGKQQKTMRDVDPNLIKEYAGEDADITYKLYLLLTEELKKNPKLWDLYWQVEEPLIQVLSEMEFSGVNLDSEFLNNYSLELTEKLKDKEKEIFDLSGHPFNIASPRQVGQVLFDELGVHYRWRKTKTGQYSTSEEKLNELSGEHQVIDLILKHRSLSKLSGTYVSPLPTMVNPRTNRLHSSFNQALTATGRLSSNNPNIQNIPIKTEEGRMIRKAFIARDKDHCVVSADYSQIELRLIAEMSGDEKMLDAFKKGQDIHSATAAHVYGVALEEVKPNQRRNAKTVNFSIIYGAGATNLSQQLDISRNEASELIKQYFAQYQGIKRYMDDTVEFARANGYVETLKGRRRLLRDINSKNGLMRSNAERMAINTPIQGTAADMIKIAMYKVDQAIKKVNLKSQLIMQVHDELVFDVPRDELEQLKELVVNEMQTALPELNVPILAEIGHGENWLEAH